MKKFSATRSLVLLFVVGLLVIAAGVAAAQGTLQVTTLRNSNLRAGPGTNYASLGVVPFNTTLTATGRSSGNSWIQVNYNGTSGWIAAFLLNVRGDVNSLPLTGFLPTPTQEFFTPTATLTPTPTPTPVPAENVTGTTRGAINVRSGPSTSNAILGQLPGGTTVPLNGRWGSGGQMWVRFDYNGRVGWLAGWLLDITGNVNTLPDLQAQQAAQDVALAALNAALPTICRGGTAPQAAAYVPGPGIHPALVYGDDGAVHAWNASAGAWTPANPLDTQLVICLGPQRETVIQECFYNGPSIFRYGYAVDARIVAAQTGQVVTSTTLTGAPPRECRQNEPWQLTRIDGEAVTFDQLRSWAQPVVAP